MNLPGAIAEASRMSARSTGNLNLMLAKQAANPKQIAEAIVALREAANILERATTPAKPIVNPPARSRIRAEHQEP